MMAATIVVIETPLDGVLSPPNQGGGGEDHSGSAGGVRKGAPAGEEGIRGRDIDVETRLIGIQALYGHLVFGQT